MELLETQDPEKRRLIETSDRHKQELEKEVKAISDKTERIVKNALIIGGTLAVTYLIVSQLSSSKKKRKKAQARPQNDQDETPDSILGDVSEPDSSPSFLSQLGERVTAGATAILLGIAKEKLAEYLSNRRQKDENS